MGVGGVHSFPLQPPLISPSPPTLPYPPTPTPLLPRGVCHRLHHICRNFATTVAKSPLSLPRSLCLCLSLSPLYPPPPTLLIMNSFKSKKKRLLCVVGQHSPRVAVRFEIHLFCFCRPPPSPLPPPPDSNNICRSSE